MTKGKKRGLKIRDVLHLVNGNVEENRMDPNLVEADERTLRARKRLSKSNMASQMNNMQIQQQAPIGVKMQTVGINMGVQSQANRFDNNLPVQQQVHTAQIMNGSQRQPASWSHEHCSPHQQIPIYGSNMEVQSQANRFESNLPAQQVQTAQLLNGEQTLPASWTHGHHSAHQVQSAGLESLDECGSSDESQSETIKKRGRGPAQFPDEWDNGKRLQVTLNAKGQIIGDDYQKLATVIGCLAKVGTNFPITKNWPEVDERYKELAWQEIEQKTFLPMEAKPIVYEMINSSCKQWKHRIKVHFKKFEHNDDNDKEMIEKLDNRVIVSQFREAVNNWRKSEVQERALTNATNRGQRKFPHRTGRTAFSEVANELVSKGLSATQTDMWLITRNLGKGVQDDEETSDVHEFLMGTINKVPIEERTAEFKAKLYQEVVQNNKRGKVTCVGKTIHKMLNGSSTSRGRRTIQESEAFTEQVLSLKEEKEEYNQMKEDMRLKMAALDELIATYGAPQPSPRIGSCSANGMPEVPDATSIGRQVQLAPAPSIRKDGRKVDLLGDGIPKQVVAHGIVLSEDPRAKVANMPLGPDHWKIIVENVICPTYILSGSVEDGDAFTIGQAINTVLAWPKVDVLEN